MLKEKSRKLFQKPSPITRYLADIDDFLEHVADVLPKQIDYERAHGRPDTVLSFRMGEASRLQWTPDNILKFLGAGFRGSADVPYQEVENLLPYMKIVGLAKSHGIRVAFSESFSPRDVAQRTAGQFGDLTVHTALNPKAPGVVRLSQSKKILRQKIEKLQKKRGLGLILD